MKRFIILMSVLLGATMLSAQPKQLILSRSPKSITFAVDDVALPASHLPKNSAVHLARQLHQNTDSTFWISTWESDIIASSFADDEGIINLGEDVVFRMLLEAWSQHRPVVLSPDVIWLLICQQLSYYVNQNPEKMRPLLVDHEGKKRLVVQVAEPLADQSDWSDIIAGFTHEISKYTSGNIAGTLVADFSTTGADELIASEVTLMDVVKPYFEYVIEYVVCGIPSITLTGTPGDWKNLVGKTKILEAFGLGWWAKDLEPILEEFVNAAEGHPDYWFWKDIVKKSRPRRIQGPTCSKVQKPLTKYDGWFLKFFPFGWQGRTPEKVTILDSMLAETVAVPFEYLVKTPSGEVLNRTELELVAGIVGVREDEPTYTLTPVIGWFVRTAKPGDVKEMERQRQDSISRLYYPHHGEALARKAWGDGPLTLDDFDTSTLYLPEVAYLGYTIGWEYSKRKEGNTLISFPAFKAYMNPRAAWIHPDYRTDLTLKYLQTGFDYLELCKRKAQQEYFDGNYYNPDDVINLYEDAAEGFIEQFKAESRHGQDSAAVGAYSNWVKDELAKTPDAFHIDLRDYHDVFHLGLSISAGSEAFLGECNSYVTPMAGAGFGLDFGINRLALMLDGMLALGSGLKQDLTWMGNSWNSGDRMGTGHIQASFGYACYKSLSWRIVPFAGIGVGLFDNYFAKENKEIAGFRFQAGVCADYIIMRQFDYKVYKPLFGNELSELSLRAKFFFARTSFPAPAPAWSVNFGIGIALDGRYLKR